MSAAIRAEDALQHCFGGVRRVRALRGTWAAGRVPAPRTRRREEPSGGANAQFPGPVIALAALEAVRT